MKTVEITQMINTMSVDELKQRLTDYITNDPQLMPQTIAIEVRMCNKINASCRYEVVLVNEDGAETIVKFRDRYARLMYIYTLMHPKGYQRYTAEANDFKTMRALYSMLYFRDGDNLLKTANKNREHFFNHYVAQARNAIRQATTAADRVMIAPPQQHNGKLLIPFVAEGGQVIIDETLKRNM